MGRSIPECNPWLRRKTSFNLAIFRKLILDSRERVLHHDIETTLSDVRSKFWIVTGGKAVKSVLRKCVTCRRYQGRPLLPWETPDIPDHKVNILYAFQSTELDSAGPFSIKNYTNTTLKNYFLHNSFKPLKSSFVKIFMLRLGVRQKFYLPCLGGVVCTKD